MPPLPVIADTYRVTINYSAAAGVTPHNVLHFRSATGTEEQLSIDIQANWTAAMWTGVSGSIEPLTLDIIALDGSSAQQTFTCTSTPNGTGTGDAIPAAAAVLAFRTAQRGPQGRGRLFLGPLAESAVTNGMLASASSTALVTAWETFQDAMTAETSVWNLVVASYTHAVARTVTSMSCRLPVGTIRRRQDQLVS